jgi:hypothetical protein
MPKRARKPRTDEKLLQAYLPADTMHKLKVAVAIRGQTLTEAVNEWAQAMVANLPALPVKPRR